MGVAFILRLAVFPTSVTRPSVIGPLGVLLAESSTGMSIDVVCFSGARPILISPA
jgi:hypothetical protein